VPHNISWPELVYDIQILKIRNPDKCSFPDFATVITKYCATVKRYHYDSHDQLSRHLADFVSAYNFGRRLKTLKGLTPYELVCKRWTIEPQRFKLDPIHQYPGLNS
jgi:hypothetical protein